LLALLALVSAMIAAAVPAQTRPGTVIANTAAVTFTLDAGERAIRSNTVTLTVAERLDLALVAGDGAPVLTDRPTPLPVRLTNRGTGQEAFALNAAATAATVTGIAIDVDGDGRFDPAIDTLLAGGTTPPVAPGGTLRLLVLATTRPDTSPSAGAVTLTARALTGTGAPAAGFEGAGDDGSDAVVGPTGATASVDLPFLATAPDAPTLVKTQAVQAAGGMGQPGSGTVVTYTLVASFPAATRGARIDDPIPAGTRYLPGTLTLDGAALTDAVDGDAGALAGEAIAVTLGDVAAATTRTVRFQVRLP
jgi:hypothetical protein